MTNSCASHTSTLTKLTYASLIAAMTVFVPEFALAQEFTEQIGRQLVDTVDLARNFTYILAAAAIIVFAIMAFFGKFQWSRLIYIIVGVVIVAGAFELIDQLSGGFAGNDASSDRFLD